MQRLRRWKRFALLIAAALLGSNLASAVTPTHALPVSAAQVSAADHHHDRGPVAPHADCAAACAASASCGSAPMPVPAHIVAAFTLGPVRTSGSQPLDILESINSLPESPPPRA